MKVAESNPTLCDHLDYTLHELLQARILEWVAFPFSRGSSQPRDPTQVSGTPGRFFTSWATREAQEYWSGWPIPSPADLPHPEIQLGSPSLQVDSLPAELPGKPILFVNCPKVHMLMHALNNDSIKLRRFHFPLSSCFWWLLVLLNRTKTQAVPNFMSFRCDFFP